MKFKTKAMPKKKGSGAAKKSSKKKVRDGSNPNALGLTGPGVEVIHIQEITDAINDYEDIMRKRVALSAKEVPAKELVVSLMSKHEDQLRNPKNGLLTYHIDEKRYVEITPSKVQIKFKEEKAAKSKKGKTAEQNAKIDTEQQD